MFIETALISFIVGKLRRGKIRNLENTFIKGWYLLFIAAFIQILLLLINRFASNDQDSIIEKHLILLHGLSYLLIFLCIIFNIKKNYMKLLLIGALLNFMVIFANGGKMPVSVNGLSWKESTKAIAISDKDFKHIAMDENTRLPYLADIILIPRPYPLPKILSIGDIFLNLGLFFFLQSEMIKEKKIMKQIKIMLLKRKKVSTQKRLKIYLTNQMI